VHGQATYDHVLPGSSLGYRESVGIDSGQLAFRDQSVELLQEFATLIAVHAQFTDELFETSRALRLSGDLLQNAGVGNSGQ
jgi:hypothetical protein